MRVRVRVERLVHSRALPFNLYRYHHGGGVFFTSGLAAFSVFAALRVRVRGVFRAPCGGGVRVVGSARCVVVLRVLHALQSVKLRRVRFGAALRPCFGSAALSKFVIQAARRGLFASACYGFGLASAFYGFGGGALASALRLRRCLYRFQGSA